MRVSVMSSASNRRMPFGTRDRARLFPMRRLLFVLAFALAATANGEDIPDWKAILVRFTIRPEGDLHVREQIDLDASAATFVIAREYPFDPDQPMHFESISKVTDLETNASVKLERGALDKANHFDKIGRAHV